MTNLVLTRPESDSAPATAGSRHLTTAGSRRLTAAGWFGLAAVLLSALFMTQLTVAGNGRMSLLDTTMSDYVFIPGVGWMFGVALLCVCAAGIGAMIALAAIRLLTTTPRLTLGLAVLGSLLAAIFPTDLGASLSLSAQIHRYAAGVVFFCVPIAARLVTRQLIGVGYLSSYRKRMTGTMIATSVVLVLFLASQFGPTPDLVADLNGLLQRVLFVLELALLAQLILLPLRFPSRATDYRVPVAAGWEYRTAHQGIRFGASAACQPHRKVAIAPCADG